MPRSSLSTARAATTPKRPRRLSRESLAQAGALRRIDLHYGQAQAWQARDAGYRIIAMIAGSGGGKALALDTPIPTPTGWTTMGEIAIGDQVLDEQGCPCSVLDATPVMTGHACYDVEFSDGTIITADADHLWQTWPFRVRKNHARRVSEPTPGWADDRPQCQPQCAPSVITTEEMRATILHQTPARTCLNHAIPLAGALQLPEQLLPIDPYVLGVWLGDGTSQRAEITTMDDAILQEIERAGYAIGAAYGTRSGQARQYRIGAKGRVHDPVTGRWIVNSSLESDLRALGLLNNKHIPPAYLRASEAQREALLMGLMDTDGTIGQDGGCCFDNTNRLLAEAVYDLAAGLGIKPTWQERDVTGPGGVSAHCYRVAFTPHRPVFHLPRKRARQRLNQVRQTQYWRYITEVRERPSVPVRCITVDAPSHLYLASRAYIPTHNTYYGPRHFYPLFATPDGLSKTYLWTEPTFRMLKRVMLPTILPFLDAFEMGKMNYSDMVYNLRGGGIILFGSTDNPNSLQGAHINGGIWADEVGLYTKEAWDVLMQRAAFYKAHILATTTPYLLPWVETELAKPASDPRTAHIYRLIQFPSYVNPAYPLDEYFRLKRQWPADKFRRLMEGKFSRIGGLCFDEFSAERNLATIYPVDQPGGGRPHLWFKHPIEGEREIELVRVWAAQDWGWSPDPGCQMLAGSDAYGRIYVFEEDYETFIPVEQGTSQGRDTWTRRALRRHERYGLDAIYADPSRPDDIAAMQAWGLPIFKANNSHEYGFDTVNQAFRLLGDSTCGLYIAQNACINLLRTIDSYVRAKAPNLDGVYLPKAAPYQEDHAEDTLRYLITGNSRPADPGVHNLPPLIRGARRGAGFTH